MVQVIRRGREAQGRGIEHLNKPTLAIDFPLKALVWEDAGGKVWLSYNSPAYLATIYARHGVTPDPEAGKRRQARQVCSPRRRTPL